MAYVAKTNWVNNDIVDAAAINKIEQGIKDVTDSNATKAPAANPTFTGKVTLPVPVDPSDAAQLKNITDISNQVLKTTSSPTFAGITISGPSVIAQATLGTHALRKDQFDAKVDQAVKITSSPTFAGITLTGPITVQTATLDAHPIRKDQFDASVNQGVKTTNSPTFAGLTVTGTVTANRVVGAVYA